MPEFQLDRILGYGVGSRYVFSLMFYLYLLCPFTGCPEAPGVCIGVYSLVIIFLLSGLVKLFQDIFKWNVCSYCVLQEACAQSQHNCS